MLTIDSSIEFLQRLPLYETEKPYYCLVAPEDFIKDKRIDNLEFESCDVSVTDIRDRLTDFSIDRNGFQVTEHHSQVLEQSNLTFPTLHEVKAYQTETEAFLKEQFDAELVFCYDFRERRNEPFEGRDQIDLNDPLLIEGPAKGAHSDVTYHSGPQIICRYLPKELQARYFKQGQFRFRIMNTWRPLVAALEDQPLALCDVQSVELHDLVPADRILPDRVGEVYYLHHNPKQRWHFLNKQEPSEPYIFVMYDTLNGDQAKIAPHVSFSNPRKSPDAVRRRSVETRSIVINRIH